MTLDQLREKLNGKKVLFFTTKNLSYLRNAQEIAFLRESGAMFHIVGSDRKSYLARVLKAYGMGIVQILFFRPQVIFAGFAPQLLLPFLWLSRKQGKWVVMDFFISLYDTMVDDRKRFQPESWMARFLYKWDQRTLQLADLYLADTEADRIFFSETFQIKGENGLTWYLCADSSIYFPFPSRKPEEWQKRYTVLYFGSILPLQGVEVVVEAVAQLKDCAGLQFILVGPLDKIPGAEAVQQQANVVCYSWLPQRELAEKISMADLCLAGHFNKEIGKAKRTIPGKAYIYAAMEKPMILGDSPANHELYQEDGEQIFFVPQGDAGALAKQIVRLAQKGGFIPKDE